MSVEANTNTATSTAPRCPRCAHYYITYDPVFPYGCRALGFKSRNSPEKEVQGASGLPCQTFTAKAAPKR